MSIDHRHLKGREQAPKKIMVCLAGVGEDVVEIVRTESRSFEGKQRGVVVVGSGILVEVAHFSVVRWVKGVLVEESVDAGVIGFRFRR